MPVVIKSGISGLIAALPGLLSEGAEATANDIGDLAQQLAPVDTGALRESKVVEKRGLLWVIAFRIGYAVHQEYGTAVMAAQPFLTPAVRAIDLTFRFKEKLNEAIARSKV